MSLARDEFFHGHLRRGTGEVLAWGTREVMGARAVVHRWMLSAQHRAILLSPAARRAGVGVALGGGQGEAGVSLVVVASPADFPLCKDGPLDLLSAVSQPG